MLLLRHGRIQHSNSLPILGQQQKTAMPALHLPEMQHRLRKSAPESQTVRMPPKAQRPRSRRHSTRTRSQKRSESQRTTKTSIKGSQARRTISRTSNGTGRTKSKQLDKDKNRQRVLQMPKKARRKRGNAVDMPNPYSGGRKQHTAMHTSSMRRMQNRMQIDRKPTQPMRLPPCVFRKIGTGKKARGRKTAR